MSENLKNKQFSHTKKLFNSYIKYDKTIPQNTAKINIEKIILGMGTLKERAINVPPMGVKSKGVKKAIPQIPNFIHILTAKRERLENKVIFLVLYFANNR